MAEEQESGRDPLDEFAIDEPDTPTEPEVDPDENLPEELKGKSREEIASMYRETKSFAGSQANEIGELRRSIDSLLEAQPKEAPRDDPPDFFEDPQAAVAATLESHPAIQEAKANNEFVKRQQAEMAVRRAHPDADDIVSSPEFQKFAGENEFRQSLLKRAAHADSGATVELISLYKAHKEQVEVVGTSEKKQRSQDVKTASTGASRGTGATTKKTLRRADIVHLKMTDPQRYESMKDEIYQAYAEGRVK